MRFHQEDKAFSGAERALLITVALAVVLLVGMLLRQGAHTAASDAARTLRDGAGALGPLQSTRGLSSPRAQGHGGAGPAASPARAQSPSGTLTYDRTPTLQQLLDDPFIQQQLDLAWSDSNPNAPDVPRGQPGSPKQEQGGWIVWNKVTGHLEVIRLPAGTRDGMPDGGLPPNNDQQQLVGSFHTHPNTAAEGYSSGPSPADIRWTNSYSHVPEIIPSHDGIYTIPQTVPAQTRPGGGGGGCSAGGPAPPGVAAPLLLLCALPVCGMLRRKETRMVTHARIFVCISLVLSCGTASLGCQRGPAEVRADDMSQKPPLAADEQARIAQAAADHVMSKKGWQRAEFRVDVRGVTPDQRQAIVWAVYLQDEARGTRGGGQSVELRVDRKTLQVVQELHFQ